MRDRSPRFAAALCLLALSAQGYIPPHWSILRRVAEHRDDLQLSTLKVLGNLSFHGAAAQEAGAALGPRGSGAELSVEAAVYFKLPGRCRLEISSPSGKAWAAIYSGAKARTEGGEIPALRVAVSQLCALLAARSSSEQEGRGFLERHLSRLGVDFKETSLGRFAGQVAFVLGERAEERPQLWVYKDSYQPARLRFSDEQGTSWEVRLFDFSSPASGEWFPRTVEVHQGGELAARFTVASAEARAKLDDRMF